MLMSSHGINYALDEHTNLSQCGSYATASDIKPYYNRPRSLVGRHSISNVLPC